MKKIISLLLVLIMLFCMTACGGDDESVPVDDMGGDSIEETENGGMASTDQTSADGDGRGDLIDGDGRSDLIDEGGRGDLIDEGGRGDLIDEGGRGDPIDGGGQYDPIGDDDESNLPYSGPDYDHPEDTDYSELVGWWYPDDDLSALFYFYFTEDGQWYRFDRSPGEEPTDTDSGSLFPDKKSDSFFYAESENAGAQYKIFLFDFDVIIMDGDESAMTLYRIE